MCLSPCCREAQPGPDPAPTDFPPSLTPDLAGADLGCATTKAELSPTVLVMITVIPGGFIIMVS